MCINFNFIIFMLLLSNGKTKITTNVIDVDDILSEDFMPGTLLMLENPSNGVTTFNETFKTLRSMEISDGSFGNAMETLGFHRSMMNEYLCRNYIAEQIVSDMTTPRIKRRMGHVAPEAELNKTSKFRPLAQNKLLNDEGSAGYKDWLFKSTTLEDIYRHYDQPQNRIDGDFIEEDEKDEEFDEEYNGHATGHTYSNEGHGAEAPPKHRGHTGLGMYYAGGKYQGGGYSYPNAVRHDGTSGHYRGGSSGFHQDGSSFYHNGGDVGYSHSGGFEDHAGGNGHSGYGGSGYSYHDHESDGGGGHPGYDVQAIHEHEHVYHSYPPKYHGHREESNSNKEHDLADLFDIALTALAFLSFGMFIVHVIMCISAATNNTTTTAANMMMPMSMSPTATATGGGGMMTSTGTGDGSMTATGGGGTSTGMGDGTPDGGGGDSNGGGSTSTGGGMGSDGGGTGGGTTSMGMGGGSTGTAGGTAGSDNGAGSTAGGSGTDMGGGTGTGGGGTDDVGGGTGAGGTTGNASPGTGTGGGTTGTGGGSTGTGDGGAGTGGGTTASGTGPGGGRDTFKFRLRRDAPTITNPNNHVLNELARRVLISIEAALIANNDDGVCLRKSLCENNKFSRTLEGKDKIIIPMWSLGMSWLSGRLVKSVSPATSMLDTLKASILGLGKANCEIIYQECDLRGETMERKRKRRRKRGTT